MTTAQPNIDFMLPYGEALRSFIEQPFITKADLRMFLRQRGIFMGVPSKEETIPVAICCLFCPSEFDDLRELQSHREDNLKSVDEFLPWTSEKSILDSLPDINSDTLFGEGYGYCKVLGQPSITPVGNNPDHVRVDFEMERNDISKSWASTTNVFKGSVTLEKVFDGKTVRMVVTHTASETKHLGQRIKQRVKEHFKATGAIPNATDKTQILFTDFNNEQRIQFFLALTGLNGNDVLEFTTVCDVDVCPDKKSGALPERLDWMEQRVSALKVGGTNLHEAFFIKEVQYHKHLLIYRMDVRFSFRYHAAAGTCTISFEFAGFNNEDIRAFEFETNIAALSVAEEFGNVNKTAIKEHLLRTIQLYAFDQYRKVVGKEA